MEKITKEISLTFEQWEIVAKALDYYENAAIEFMSIREAREFRENFILPVYKQMPEQVF